MCHELSWSQVVCGHPSEDPSIIRCEKVIKAGSKCEDIEDMPIPAYGPCEKCANKSEYALEDDLEISQEGPGIEVIIESENEADTEEKGECMVPLIEEKKFEADEGIRKEPQQDTPEQTSMKDMEEDIKKTEQKRPFVPGERIRYRPNNNTPGTSSGKKGGGSKVEALCKAFEHGKAILRPPF